jgi:RNA polymerase sigma-70 factor (ECF subfamily)
VVTARNRIINADRPPGTIDLPPKPEDEPEERGVQEPGDEVLVARFRAGDAAAFDMLVKRHQRALYFLARRYVGNDADAQDVAQRALVQAFTQLSSLRDQRSFRFWIYKTAANLALNVLRDRKPQAELTDDTIATPATQATIDPLVVDERQKQLRAAVASLPPQQRLVVELRVYEELPFAEVAEVAGCSEESARVNYHYALKRLRQRMNEDES